LVSAVWLLALVIVGWSGEFPLSDDWAHAKPVQTLLDRGQMTRVEWTFIPLITHTLLGAAFAAVFGLSFEVLRLSSLLMGWVGLLGMYVLARQAGTSRSIAAFIALLLALNPLYLNLSYTFMTDVPFTAMLIWSIVLWVHGLRSNSAPCLIGGAVLVVLATLSRQFGLAFAAGMGAAAILERPTRIARWAIGIGVPLLALSAYLVLPPLVYGDVRRGTIQSDFSMASSFISRDSALFHVLRNGTRLLATVGLFLLPLTLLGLKTLPVRKRPMLAAIAIVAVPPLLLMAWKGWRLPAFNVIHERGIGSIELKGAPSAGPALTAFWWTITVAGIFSIALLAYMVLTCCLRRRQYLRRDPVLVCTIGCTVLYLLCTVPWRFDRYLIPVLPTSLLAIVLLFLKNVPLRLHRLPIAVLVVLGAISVLGTRDYLRLNQVRWDMLASLRHRGVTSDRIDGGFEFNAWHNYLGFRDGDIHASPKGHWVVDDEYLIGQAASVPGYVQIEQRTVPRTLPGTARLALFHRQASAEPPLDASRRSPDSSE
jgi:hypothetical protein